jgi:hypothetical protein
MAFSNGGSSIVPTGAEHPQKLDHARSMTENGVKNLLRLQRRLYRRLRRMGPGHQKDL